MNRKIQLPDFGRIVATLRHVPTVPAVVAGVSTLAFVALVLKGLTWWVALGTVVVAVAIGFLVLVVPRQMILETEVDRKTPEEQEEFFEAAAAARWEHRQRLIAAGVIEAEEGD